MAIDFGPFVFGGNIFGWTATREESFRLLDAFVEQGGTTIDTADVYSNWIPGGQGGESEQIIGEWLSLRKNRARVQIATKVGMWAKRPGLSPSNIRAAIEDSLQRLRTDYVDLYYAHQDDQDVEQSEYLSSFDALVREGKVRVLGASNFTPERLASALTFSRAHQLHAFSVSQDHWNLVERKLERHLVPLLEREGLVELPYWSLASGFLTGKYRPGAAVDSARVGAAEAYLNVPQNLELLTRLDELAQTHQTSVAVISLAWLHAQRVIGAPIASARTLDQLTALFGIKKVTLSPEEVESLSRITRVSAGAEPGAD